MNHWLLILTVTAACSHPPSHTTGSGPGSGSSAPVVADDPGCPLTVPGTSISFEDGKDGPALVFVTTGDVAAVRKRAAALASRRGSLAQMFSTAGAASDVEGGARVVYTPADADSLRMHAQMLSGATSCEMKM